MDYSPLSVMLGEPIEDGSGGSKNVSCADNQQERLMFFRGGKMKLNIKRIPPDMGYYLAGFADGEGSFNISFRPRSDYLLPWKVSLCFNVSQKDPVVLVLFKKHLQCGTMRQRKDGIWYYEVNNINPVLENVIPFFERFRFLSSKKKRDFSKFKRMAEIIRDGGHLSKEGIEEILRIRQDMNDGGKRRYSAEEINKTLENPQRLYAESGDEPE